MTEIKDLDLREDDPHTQARKEQLRRFHNRPAANFGAGLFGKMPEDARSIIRKIFPKAPDGSKS